MVRAYLGLGGNIGERRDNMRAAVDRIRRRFSLIEASSLYETEPVGYRDQPPFLNAVLVVEAPDDPHGLMRDLLEIELDLGRHRTFANAPRTIDIDVLLFGDRIIETGDLTVPHPRMHERGFVLAPLTEVAPELVHPVLGKTVRDLADELGDDREGIVCVAGPEWANG